MSAESEQAAKIKSVQERSTEARDANPLRDVAVDKYESRTSPESRSEFYTRVVQKNPGD